MIKLTKSFIVVFLFIFLFSLKAIPKIDKHFIFPVLTGIPKKEETRSDKYVLISEQNEEVLSIVVRLSPIEEMIFLPPNNAPKNRKMPTKNDKGIKMCFSLKFDPKRNKIIPKNLSPL